MALIVKYKFQNVDANGNSVSLLPQFPSNVSYTKTDVVEGNITTRVIETDDLSKITYIRFGCNESTYVAGAWEYLTEILDINISYVNTFYRMFRGCNLLNIIDVSNWDTSNVINMSYMFYNCRQLTTIGDVSNWDTSEVTDMGGMFQNCSQLAQLDVSNWNTSKVISMDSIFQNCSQLAQLDVSNWDISKVTKMTNMFYGCSQLTQLDVSNWNTSNVTKMTNMFYQCSKLIQLDVSNFDTSNVKEMNNIFANCKVENVGLIYCSEDTINKLANCITSPCNFYVTNKTYTSPNPLVKYVMYREDKKQILYYNNETQTWEKPVLRQWDTIEKHSDGKYYYHKRSGEVVLNGSGVWGLNSNNSIVYNNEKLPNVKAPINNSLNAYIPFVCDRLIPTNIDTIYNDTTIKGIAISKDGNIGISTNGEVLNTVKAWLQANPTTVVYQLAEEKVYECTDLDLITYADETSLMVESGGIVPKTSLKNHKNITNITTILQEKVKILDDDTNTINSEIDNINTDLIGVSESIEGSSISVDPKDGYLKDIEILGNTIQDASNLADIRSVGDKVEGQELYEIPVLSTNSGNLFNVSIKKGITLDSVLGTEKPYVGENCSDFIEINNNEIFFNTDANLNTTNNYWFLFTYDKNKLTLKNISITSKKTKYTLDKNVKYIRLGRILDATPYTYLNLTYSESINSTIEPYQEDKLTILSPVQLEKVGDVADRIICKDGVWGVEKNIHTELINGQYYFQKGSELSNTAIYQRLFTNLRAVNNNAVCIISDKFLGIKNESWKVDQEAVFLNSGGYVQFRISHASIGENTFDEYTKENNILIKAQLSEPTFIPLPHDQQVKLRTFAGQTNIYFETEIEPTLKASVPKSIGATANTHTEQIGNLSKELDRVKKLEESTVSTVVTESDFTTVTETSNGYFEDVELEGKTLVNLADKTQYKETIEGWKTTLGNIELYKTNTVYTFIGNVTALSDGVVLYISTERSSQAVLKKGYNITTFETGDSLNFITIYSVGSPGAFNIENVVILEGDHTQNPPEYFEGLKSVGEDVEEITVLSTNDNLVDYLDKSTLINNGVIVGDYLKQTISNLTASAQYNVVKGKEYTFAFDIYSDVPASNLSYCLSYSKSYGSNADGNHIRIGVHSMSNRIVINFTAKEECVYLILGTSTNITVKDISLNLGNTDGAYTLPKQDKKQILYYNDKTQTWEKPILREWDSIDKHSDGKYYYHKRSGEVVLNGSENWALAGRQFTNTIGFFKTNINTDGCKGSNYIADKFVYNRTAYSNNEDIECITNNSVIETEIVIVQINKSKLTIQDVEGFKAWLQANPTTVVYQLAEEKVYECTDLDLITHQNETNLVIKSGALTPKVSLKVSKGVGNTVKMLQNKVKVLEQTVYNLMKMLITQQSNIDE